MSQPASSDTPALLDIRNLRISFHTPRGQHQAVRGISLSMQRERIAVVGESGSGKSITFRSLLGLLPAHAQVQAERMHLGQQDLRTLNPRELRGLRGRRIGMVVQDPKQGLDPLMTIGRQLVEMLRLHTPLSRRQARERAGELLADVHIRNPQRVLDLYPHEVSGGMAQRAMLAMILSAEPDLLIADEATSALDAVVRHRILDLIDEQVQKRGMGLILISHDLDLVANYADRVVVMYAGRIMEELNGQDMHAAKHAYTQGLMACRPSIDHPVDELPVLQRKASWLQ